MRYGHFINTLLTFPIIAAVVYLPAAASKAPASLPGELLSPGKEPAGRRLRIRLEIDGQHAWAGQR